MHARLKYLGMAAGCATLVATIAFAAGPVAKPSPDKHTARVPGGLALSEFKGYESWQVISASHKANSIAVTVGNPKMIEAYEAGFPANGKPVPDGAKMAKIHWLPKKHSDFPDATVPKVQHDVDFMVKDSKRFGDVGGWGYAMFKYDAATDTFTPGTTADHPPQANDAKCGVACHTVAQARDFVFTEYAHR